MKRSLLDQMSTLGPEAEVDSAQKKKSPTMTHEQI